ncbi:lipoprotein [Microbulbifer salipaludis]|uniref:Lipoprotein n=1 Tax=Microbulbifer salipaludis TaxID=187980 RepID=A0ABS3E2E1_9GAMM|nr:lipoprotein [Microbulbifer salipaludis]MBN8429388.1 lipoprotein [Microbulbifer salipaludis]
MRTPLISLVALAAVSLVLSACGQKGPLYLPQDPAAPAARSAVQPGSVDAQQSTRTEEKTEQQTEQHTEAEAVSK